MSVNYSTFSNLPNLHLPGNTNNNTVNLDKKLGNIGKNKSLFTRISNTFESRSKNSKSLIFLNQINDIIIKTINTPSDKKIEKLNKIKELLKTFKIKKESFTDLISQANGLIQKIDYYIKILGLDLNKNIEKKILFIQEFVGINRNIQTQQKNFYLKFLDNVIKIYNSAIQQSNNQKYLEQLSIIDKVVHPFIRKIYTNQLTSNNDIELKFQEIKNLEAELNIKLASKKKNLFPHSNLHNA